MSSPASSIVTNRKRDSSSSRAKNCAECRRLKIKCDRQVPCSNCVKRGTASICPDGQLLSKGHRFILSNTEDLHSQIEELTSRVNELEEALAKLQAEYSDDPHPLLATENDEPLVTSFGSLVIGKDGNSRFFGATSSVEWVVMMDSIGDLEAHGEQGEEKGASFMMDAEHPLKKVSDLTLINTNAPLFVPEEVIDVAKLRKIVVAELPERELGTILFENYYGRVAWEMAPVLRTRFISEFFAPCYADTDNPPITAHELAFVYAVFGLGMLHSPEIRDSTPISRRYISLSQACLTIENPFTNITITAVDTLLLHVAYTYHLDDVSSAAKGWATLGVAMKLAQMIGLQSVPLFDIPAHASDSRRSREPSMWGLPPVEVTQRRRTMWELVSCDLWAALITGRPPMISRQHFDVQLPIEDPDVTDPDPNFSLGKHHFSEACLWSALDLGLASANKASYADVLKVDNKIRQWSLPHNLKTRPAEHIEEKKTVTNFRNATEMIFKEVTLMCLHRCYFAAALLDPQFDLHKHQYSRSVLAAYASSCAILSRVRALYALEPVVIMKFSFFWTHSFSAAVILGAITTKAPDCSLAYTALSELNLAVELFASAQHSGSRARRGLPTLLHLQSSAQAARDAFQQGSWSRQAETDSTLLQTLGGAGAILHRQPQDRNVSPHPTPGMGSDGNNNQPTLEEYLRSFDFHSTPNDNSAPLHIPTSDEFLQGVLTGNWGGLFPPSTGPGSSQPGSTSNIPGREQHFGSHNYYKLHPQIASYAPSMHSDGDSSINSGGASLAPTSSMEPPPLLYQHSNQEHRLKPNQSDDLQKTFLWDNFLRELGIENI